MIGVYFETWASLWTDTPSKMDLATAIHADIVNLAFALPNCKYTPGSFAGTGLEFSQSFSVVKDAIALLHKTGTRVMLSIGGGDGNWDSINIANIKSLVVDLGLDGVDLDYEIDNPGKWASLIPMFRPNFKYLSAAVFSTGAYGPKPGIQYQGMNIPGLYQYGEMLDWINIMAYDAGKSFDPLGAYDCYKIYYKGPILVGFELGKQGWGDALLTSDQITAICNYVKKDGNGIFIWGYGSQSVGTPSFVDTLTLATKLLGMQSVPPQSTPPTIPTQSKSLSITCPKCSTLYTSTS